MDLTSSTSSLPCQDHSSFFIGFNAYHHNHHHHHHHLVGSEIQDVNQNITADDCFLANNASVSNGNSDSDHTYIAPADELFFKGQILPLQPHPRLHLLQSLSNCSSVYPNDRAEKGGNEEEEEGNDDNNEKDEGEIGGKDGRSDEDMPLDNNGLNLVSHLKYNTGKKVNPNPNPNVPAPSTTSYASNVNRCSSFRSQNSSSFWDSSRDSNGSSQDSYNHHHHHAGNCSHGYKNITTQSNNNNRNDSTNTKHSACMKGKLLESLCVWKAMLSRLMGKQRKKQKKVPEILMKLHDSRIISYSEDLSKYQICMDRQEMMWPCTPGAEMSQYCVQNPASMLWNDSIAKIINRSPNPRASTTDIMADINRILKPGASIHKGSNDSSLGEINPKLSTLIMDNSIAESNHRMNRTPETSLITDSADGIGRSWLSSSKPRTSKLKPMVDIMPWFSNAGNASPDKEFEEREESHGQTYDGHVDSTNTRDDPDLNVKWLTFARKLKPLYEMKRGLMMGRRFRFSYIDEYCGGKNACEIVSNSPMPAHRDRSSSPPHHGHSRGLLMSERPSFGISSIGRTNAGSDNNKQGIDERELSRSSSGLYANMSSIKLVSSLGLRSANANGSLPCGDRVSNPKVSRGTRGKCKNPRNSDTKASDANYDNGMSTMQEMRSSLQGAIAHCKESNQKEPGSSSEGADS